MNLAKGLLILSLKISLSTLGFIDLSHFYGLYFIYFLSDLYYFLPSAKFGLCLFFFLIPIDCVFEIVLVSLDQPKLL